MCVSGEAKVHANPNSLQLWISNPNSTLAQRQTCKFHRYSTTTTQQCETSGLCIKIPAASTGHGLATDCAVSSTDFASPQSTHTDVQAGAGWRAKVTDRST